MCGIAGIIGRVDDANRAALDRMQRALIHRGPDAAGSWAGRPDADGFGCMLAFRRLAILDLTDCANQPMVEPKTGQALVFNGEIYNYQSLRDQLGDAGHVSGEHRPAQGQRLHQHDRQSLGEARQDHRP